MGAVILSLVGVPTSTAATTSGSWKVYYASCVQVPSSGSWSAQEKTFPRECLEGRGDISGHVAVDIISYAGQQSTVFYDAWWAGTQTSCAHGSAVGHIELDLPAGCDTLLVGTSYLPDVGEIDVAWSG